MSRTTDSEPATAQSIGRTGTTARETARAQTRKPRILLGFGSSDWTFGGLAPALGEMEHAETEEFRQRAEWSSFYSGLYA